jgi:hypothetical protein
MKEKILAALKTKFQGVEDAILDRQAEKLAKTVEKEDQIETALSGVTFGTLLQSETDRRTTEASSTAVKNYEKKHNLKDGKSIEEPEKKKPEPPQKEEDDVPAWAKALTSKLDSYEKRLTAQEKEKERTSKLNQAKELLKASKIPDKLKDKWIKRIDVDDEETSLEDQVNALETEYIELKQDHVNESVKEGGETQGNAATDAELEEYLDDKFPKETESAEAK